MHTSQGVVGRANEALIPSLTYMQLAWQKTQSLNRLGKDAYVIEFSNVFWKIEKQ